MYLPGEGNLFTPRSDELKDLLDGIHKREIVLPDFQRPWVWEPDMVRDLIISVAYRYPAGSLLTMPVTNTNFAIRSFAGADSLEANDAVSLMVLDGQQRLTSLYQSIYSRSGVEHEGRRYHFYIDVEILLNDPDGSIDIGDPYFDQALFYVSEEKDGRRIRYSGLRSRYELTTRSNELQAGALPLSSIFNHDYLDKWKEEYLFPKSDNSISRYQELSRQWDYLVKSWLDRIRRYEFPVIQLRPDMPLSAICHIFEKVNSTGVPLDVFDLCTAILWAQGFQLNQEWKLTVEQLGRFFPKQNLSGTHYLQGITLLDSLHRKKANSNPSVAVSCRKHDLLAMRSTVVQNWWSILTEGYKEAAKFMNDQGILSERILPYSTLIVPLSTLLADIRHTQGAAQAGYALKKVERWYWCSVFSQRYSGQVETTSAQDYEQVMNWIEGGEEPDTVRTFTFYPDILYEVKSIRNAIYRGILCLLARSGAEDFGGNGRIATHIFFDTAQDHHHIFPTDALKKKGITDSRADSIVNKTLISSAVNRSIGGQLPSKYISGLTTKLQDNNLQHILNTHAITMNILVQDAWEDFVVDRRDRLYQLILSVCGNHTI